MATFDLRIGDANSLPALGSGRLTRLDKTIDFADTPYDSGDILLLWPITANTFVQLVSIKVLTLEGDTLTVDVGDYTTAVCDSATDANGYGSGVDLNANLYAYASAPPTSLSGNNDATWVLGYAMGKVYNVEGFIAMLLNNDADVAKIRASAFVYEL